jgi:tetratricopeptide (TPR) repeat protein
MWQYQWLGCFEESIAMCDRGLELADLIGSAPVQYGSIKAIALTEMGRFDEVAAAIDQEVTDDAHPFGQAIASLARSVYLTRLSAWEPAAESLLDTLERAAALSRVWMQNWGQSLLVLVEANLRAAGRPVPTSAPIVSGDDSRLVGMLAGLPGAEVALVEGRLDDVLSLAERDAERSVPTPNQVRALDLVARARLEMGDLEAAATAAERALAIAESMRLGTAIWRLRMVQATARGETTDLAAAEFRALADRISEPDLRWWFEHQPLAPR